MMGFRVLQAWEWFVAGVDSVLRLIIAAGSESTLLQVVMLFLGIWLFSMGYWVRQLGDKVLIYYRIMIIIYFFGILVWIMYY